MFAGKTYVLFLYTYIKDVLTEFSRRPLPSATLAATLITGSGHATPAIFRSCVLTLPRTVPPPNTPMTNVPYQPEAIHTGRTPKGVDEGDYVMLIGYPGRTARHKTASFLKYEQDVRLPYVVKLYQWQIERMQQAGKEDRAIALKHSSRMKSLANVEKRSRGQLKGLLRKDIVATRAAAESKLQAFIDSDANRREKYGSLLRDIAAVYSEMESKQHELDVENLRSASRLMYFALRSTTARWNGKRLTWSEKRLTWIAIST